MFGFFKKKPQEQPKRETEAICNGYVITITVTLSAPLPQSIVHALRSDKLSHVEEALAKSQRISDPRLGEEELDLSASHRVQSWLRKA